jgi:RNA-directed DNA polymerase
MNKWPSPRAMASIRVKIRDLTAPRQVGLPLEVVVEQLNPSCGAGGLLPPRQLLGEVRRDRLLRPRTDGHPGQQETRRSGFNWTDRYPWGWLGNLGIHRLEGTVRYPAANA